MRIFDTRWVKSGVVNALFQKAKTGTLNINHPVRSEAYRKACMGYHTASGTLLCLTRDAGHHTSGFFKNPDYERCLHLSLSFRNPVNSEEMIACDRPLTRDWTELVFAGNRSLIWAEPPYSPEGKKADVWHYRLFLHEDWKTPLLPRGEVYSRQFTEAGWKSWSDVQADILETEYRMLERQE